METQQQKVTKMDFRKCKIKSLLLILVLCILVVLLFPFTSNDKSVYQGILVTAIGIVVTMLLFLFKVHLFDSGKQDDLLD